MDYVIEFFTNFVLMSAVTGWFVAQILKGLTGVFKLKKFTITEFLFGTGGMPSSHTAAVVAVAVSCAIKCGLGSAQFGISCVLAMIVMRDAMGMRRQVGEHAKALNIIFKELAEANNDRELTTKALGELVGHTPLQVFAGVIVGAAVPFALMFVPAFGMI
ncbi:MAG: divergent PAP2 family protein [Clostridia bacterium]|nr:divergent PAP2 family protein [Clostridia bacterium]